MFEFSACGPDKGNPFQEVTFGAVFQTAGRSLEVPGFYDGAGIYRVRFMPDVLGEWRFRTRSNRRELEGLEGRFTCTPAGTGNHGPVQTADRRNFVYADGSPCFVMGTTAYAWTYRPQDVRARSLESFSTYGFNKVRMLVFPKHYGDGEHVDLSYDPPCYPYEGEPGAWNYSRFNPEFFQNFEQRIIDLLKLGIQADVILYHPYDHKWCLPQGMSEADDLFYLDYLMARIGALRNVWWSLANEYDLFRGPGWRVKNWDAIGARIAANDPYGHLISIHNWPFVPPYPDRPWMTHVSYQHPNTFSMLLDLKRRYDKPVINDEYQYEGDVPNDWGNCTGEQEVRRHWMSFMAGGYATHGEVLRVGTSIRDYFWTYGGTIRGESAPRLAYLRQVAESVPYQTMEVDWRLTDGMDIFCLSRSEDLFLYFITPEFKDRTHLQIGAGHERTGEYEAIVHDVWNCQQLGTQTLKPGEADLNLPAWAAVILKRIVAGNGVTQ